MKYGEVFVLYGWEETDRTIFSIFADYDDNISLLKIVGRPVRKNELIEAMKRFIVDYPNLSHPESYIPGKIIYEERDKGIFDIYRCCNNNRKRLFRIRNNNHNNFCMNIDEFGDYLIHEGVATTDGRGLYILTEDFDTRIERIEMRRYNIHNNDLNTIKSYPYTKEYKYIPIIENGEWMGLDRKRIVR